jgi:quercetin dioxygenase-like cupin family protein
MNTKENKNSIETFPMDVDKIISYQAKSVVSKEIITKKTGTVTLFSFDKGEGLSEHSAPFDALVYIFDGEAEIIISGVSYILKKGQLIIMPAKKPHALKAKKRFKMMLVMIKQ